MGKKRSWTDTELSDALKDSVSIGQVLDKLGLNRAGGNYTQVQDRIKVLGLDRSHLLGQSWVGRTEKHPSRKPLEEILVRGSTYKTCHLKKRLLQVGLKREVCESCGATEWLGQPIPLEVDHINGDRTDHRIDNLRLLCCNCHGLTPTWRGRKPRVIGETGIT